MVVAEAGIDTEIVYLRKINGQSKIAVRVIDPLDGARLWAAYR